MKNTSYKTDPHMKIHTIICLWKKINPWFKTTHKEHLAQMAFLMNSPKPSKEEKMPILHKISEGIEIMSPA